MRNLFSSHLLSAAPSCVADTNVNSLDLDGVNDHALFTSDLWGSLTAATLNWWVKLDTGAYATVNNRLFHCRKATWDANNRFWIDIVREDHGTHPGKVSSTMQIGGTKYWNWFFDTSAIDFEDGWHMITFVMGTAPKLYVDASDITGITDAGSAGGDTTKCFDDLSTASIDDYYLGTRYQGDLSSFDFELEGNVSKQTVWDKELSAAEITELMCGGLPLDPSTHSASGNLAFNYMLGDGTRDDFGGTEIASDELDQSAPYPTDGSLVNGVYAATPVS